MGKLLIAVGGYILSKFVTKLLAALGIAFVTYKGLEFLLNKGFDLIAPTMSGLPARILNLMALSGFPEALTIVCSAMLTSAALQAAKVFIGKAT